MVKKCDHLLNRFLLACVFLGVIMILLKEKEGFANHYYNLNEIYKVPLLDIVDKNTPARKETTLKKTRIKPKIHKGIRVGNYSQITNNYTIHPCNDNGYINEICHEMYKPNDVVIGPKQKSCMPGYECRRVGFYCSLIG